MGHMEKIRALLAENAAQGSDPATAKLVTELARQVSDLTQLIGKLERRVLLLERTPPRESAVPPQRPKSVE